MAVTLCKELFPGRHGSDGIERKLKHTRVFEVLTDDPNDDDYIAGAGDGVTIPRNGDIHPNNPFAVMVSITADQDDESPLRWLVVCEYDTELPISQSRESGGFDANGESVLGGDAGNPLARADNPLDRPASWSFEWEQVQIVAEKSRSDGTGSPDNFDGTVTWPFGTLICNSAGLPFDPPVMIEDSQPVATVVKNYPVGHAILFLSAQATWKNAVNNAEWKGFAAGTARIIGMNFTYATENGITFGRMTWRIKFTDAPDGWDLVLLDQSYAERWADDSLHKIDLPIGSGIFPDTPQKLNGNGIRLDDPALLSHDDFYLRFGIYKPRDFTELEL